MVDEDFMAAPDGTQWQQQDHVAGCVYFTSSFHPSIIFE